MRKLGQVHSRRDVPFRVHADSGNYVSCEVCLNRRKKHDASLVLATLNITVLCNFRRRV